MDEISASATAANYATGAHVAILTRIFQKCSWNWDKRYKGTPCLEWKGSHSGNGRGGLYGRISIEGFTCAVHRVVFICVYGFIPPKKQVDHGCKNRKCCHPLHLEKVTHKENQKRRRITQTL